MVPLGIGTPMKVEILKSERKSILIVDKTFAKALITSMTIKNDMETQ